MQREPIVLDPRCPEVVAVEWRSEVLTSRTWRRTHQAGCERCREYAARDQQFWQRQEDGLRSQVSATKEPR